MHCRWCDCLLVISLPFDGGKQNQRVTRLFVFGMHANGIRHPCTVPSRIDSRRARGPRRIWSIKRFFSLSLASAHAHTTHEIGRPWRTPFSLHVSDDYSVSVSSLSSHMSEFACLPCCALSLMCYRCLTRKGAARHVRCTFVVEFFLRVATINISDITQ